MGNGELSLILNWIIKYAAGMTDKPLAVSITLKNGKAAPLKTQKPKISAGKY